MGVGFLLKKYIVFLCMYIGDILFVVVSIVFISWWYFVEVVYIVEGDFIGVFFLELVVFIVFLFSKNVGFM